MARRLTSLALLAPLGASALLLAAGDSVAKPTPKKEAQAPLTTTKIPKIPVGTTVRPLPPHRESPLFKKKLNTDRAHLKGFVDLHTHPMSHLAMGGKLMHGAPATNILVPKGMIYNPAGVGVTGSTCNEAPRDAKSIEEALGTCYSTHGGHDFIKNKCGNHIRRIVIEAFEKKNRTNKPHDVEHPPGYPTFTKWPKYNDILHQQMWIDWIKRAHDGGLRVMVGLAVNSMTLAKGIDGNEPYDDKSTGEEQLKQMIRLADHNHTWMEIAYSAADLRRIVAQDKLAIILGVELDDIGDFAWSKREPSRGEVKAEIDRLYTKGVRYIFPVHVIDNYFGGTAIYEASFARATKYHFGQWPQIVCASASDGITERIDKHDSPLQTIFEPLLIGRAGMAIPIPDTCHDGDRSHNRIGFKNARGLTELGKFAVGEMMASGMIIDVDHGSQKTVNDLIAFADAKGGYPLVSGHNQLRVSTRDEHISEHTRTAAQYRAIASHKGIAGIELEDMSAGEWLAAAKAALAAAPGLAINLGSDINGFVILPHDPPCTGATCVKYSAAFPKAKTAQKEWDYNTDGVAHIGLFPDFLRKIELSHGEDVVDKLFEGAESVAEMWEEAEKVGRRVRAGQPATFDTIVATVRTTTDDVRNGARAWVTVQLRTGNLPEVEITQLAKGANAEKRIEIHAPRAIRASDVVGIKVRHFSNDCFACSRDYWNGSVQLEGEHGEAIMRTPDFRIGHQTKQFPRR
jgi:microsomal dipeptidase-like Zn-dependent dipeptidase